jgi:hypothetical protein
MTLELLAETSSFERDIAREEKVLEVILPLVHDNHGEVAETSRIGFADLSGTKRLILVGGIVVAILLAGLLTYRAYRRIPRKAYDAKASKGLFDAPREMNRLLIEAQQDGVLWDPLGQRLAHFVVLAGIAGVCLADLASGGRWSRRWIEGKTRLAFWALMASLCLIPKLLQPMVWQSSLVPFLGLSTVGLAYQFGPWMRRPEWQRTFAICLAVLIVAALGPAVAIRFDIAHMHSVYTHFSKETTWGFVEESMEHWMIVVGPTDRLLHGAPLFKTARPYYGGLTTLLAVAIQRVWGEFSLRGYCTYFAFLQAICLVLAARVYYVFTGRRWALCLLPLVFAGCNFHFNTSLEYPNHTAWRTVAFPVAVWILVLLRPTTIRVCAFVLGCTSLLALINNVETGVAITAGNLTYLYFRTQANKNDRCARTTFTLVTVWVLGAVVGLLGWLLCCRLLLGAFPDLAAVTEQLYLARLFSSTGFGSIRPRDLELLALLILAHAAFAWIYSWLDRPRHQRWLTALRASVAATILVWFAYYFNRPSKEYLHDYHLLYGCLLADLLRLIVASGSQRLPLLIKGAAIVIVGMVVIPITLTQCSEQWPEYCRGVRLILTPPSPAVATEVAGAIVPAGERADMLLRKANFLREHVGPVVYLTADSYLMPKASGVWPALSFVDIFWESHTRRHYESALAEIRRAAVTEIYIDEERSVRQPGDLPETMWDPYPRWSREFFRHVRHDLESDFELVDVREGWEVWRRRPRGD